MDTTEAGVSTYWVDTKRAKIVDLRLTRTKFLKLRTALPCLVARGVRRFAALGLAARELGHEVRRCRASALRESTVIPRHLATLLKALPREDFLARPMRRELLRLPPSAEQDLPAARRGARRRNHRAGRTGMLLQDASSHEWAGPDWDRSPGCHPVHCPGFFVEEEGTMSTFQALHEVIGESRLFCSLYTDRASHYWHTPAAGFAQGRQGTQVAGPSLTARFCWGSS